MKIGDKVKLSDLGRDRYDNDEGNPHLDIGVIEGNDGSEDDVDDLPLRVRWSNDYLNSYDSRDLAPVSANTLTPGQTYTLASGRKMRVIHIEDGKAFGVFLNDNGTASLDSAYTWDMDGEYQNAVAGVRDEYRIVFEPVRTTRRTPVYIEGDAA